LVPAIAARAVAWVGLDSPDKALDLLRFLEARTTSVEGFELVPADALQLVLKHIPGTRPPLTAEHPWNVLVEATTADLQQDIASELSNLLAEALDQGLASDAVIAANEARADAFWRIRESISEAERAEGQMLAHDISVPVPDMPRFIDEASAEVERAFPGTTASAFGHLGDGNVHFHVRAGSRAAPDWYEGEAPAITRLVHDLVTAAGGSISAEHGIGQLKVAELERLAPPSRIVALRAIKQALDPVGIMNPGKLVP
jgi:FAD/FMN-containing dehydrogenase